MPNVTSVWDFSPGETLTAAKLDDVNCGIHVFSGTATRDAAYGGSGERALSEGEFAYLADTNTTQYYDGAAWQTLVTGGLTFITSATVTAQTTLTVSNVFSSTYLNYFMTYANVTTSSGGNVSLQFTTGGTANANANYQIGSWRVAYSAGAGNAGGFAVNQTTFSAVITDTSTTESFGHMYFLSPFTATNTGLNSSSSGGNQACWTNGIHTGSTSFDGIKLTATQNMTGTFRFYGIANS